MSEAPLMNDEAARSTTGEILDQATAPATTTPPPPEAKPSTTPTETSITEPKPAVEPKPGETLLTDKGEDTAKDTAKAPEAYTEFTAPEGHKLDKAVIDAATPIFKELGLTQEQAQKLVDLQARRETESAKAPQAAYETMRSDWRSKVAADAEIKAYTTDGKSGIDAVKVDIGRALGTLDPGLATEFKAAMDLTGAGDNPAFVKAFWKLSQSVIEGKHVGGKGPSPAGQVDPSRPARPSAASALFPNNPSSAAG